MESGVVDHRVSDVSLLAGVYKLGVESGKRAMHRKVVAAWNSLFSPPPQPNSNTTVSVMVPNRSLDWEFEDIDDLNPFPGESIGTEEFPQE